MTELDKGYSGNGGEGPRPEVRSMPFFPGPSGQAVPQSTGAPLTPPPLVPAQAPGGRHSQPRDTSDHVPMQPLEGREPASAGSLVKGRITIEDEVIEKIATLAALEVTGVAQLVGRLEPGDEPHLGPGGRGVRIHVHDNEVTLDLSVIMEYGSVIMDVAKVVKTNVARVVGLMLGMRIVAVNVAVEDVRMPAEAKA
ncbi:Asp23/Gls24 family envelope stress response protein [Actinomadura barringtoniae]|uniref:Asp23/Gls24 family envelope stress response protein n=1 Tax=Actinomadura barringtoniae TaxID=1427535 RepID=A0A939PI79_9ACTN|nr:Asp23/Gls24 family envelope stress response protein [Actinomadura barringtoniae]MBO2452747.1 Asp23/Gls24 family envelope stress response protein [Actinomadura barringtoniae]